MKPYLTIAIQCSNFQRRLCWMLSSLVQQDFRAGLVVDIACVVGNGKPTTEAVARLFRGHGLDVQLGLYPSSSREFESRGLVRNQQIKRCRSTWLMFGDCDMVYPADFLDRLKACLEVEHATAPYMLGSGRMSCIAAEAESLVCAHVRSEAVLVPDAYRVASGTLAQHPMRCAGAGFCQLVNMAFCPHEGYYVDPSRNRDWEWSRGSNPKSDVQFRRRISRATGDWRRLPVWFSAHSLHLNHARDPEAGRHLEDQR